MEIPNAGSKVQDATVRFSHQDAFDARYVEIAQNIINSSRNGIAQALINAGKSPVRSGDTTVDRLHEKFYPLNWQNRYSYSAKFLKMLAEVDRPISKFSHFALLELGTADIMLTTSKLAPHPDYDKDLPVVSFLSSVLYATTSYPQVLFAITTNFSTITYDGLNTIHTYTALSFGARRDILARAPKPVIEALYASQWPEDAYDRYY